MINKSHKYRNIVNRNLTEEEKDKFDNFQMSIHTIEPVKNGLDMKTKCEIFNRLQNGEKVESYVKLRNLNNNPITNYIRSSRSLAILNNFGLMKKIELNKKTKLKHDESFTMYFLIKWNIVEVSKAQSESYTLEIYDYFSLILTFIGSIIYFFKKEYTYKPINNDELLVSLYPT